MSKSKEKPFLVELGANTRGAPSKKNLDVSGTVGPDYLGQETVDVDGHWADRPGVQYRAPENHTPHVDPETGTEHIHPDIARMDTGEELPVLLSSNMKAGPIEGTQGSYTQIVEGECPRCGYDRIKVSVVTMAGEHQEQCNACEAKIGRQYENGYRMPDLPRDRADRARESGEVIGETRFSGDIVDPGTGRVYELVSDRSVTRLPIDDITALLSALEEHDRFVTEFVSEEMDGKQVKPAIGSDNPNAVDSGIIRERFDKSYIGISLWIKLNRVAMNSSRPVYFPPHADGVKP